MNGKTSMRTGSAVLCLLGLLALAPTAAADHPAPNCLFQLGVSPGNEVARGIYADSGAESGHPGVGYDVEEATGVQPPSQVFMAYGVVFTDDECSDEDYIEWILHTIRWG